MGMYNDYYKKYYSNIGQQGASKAYVPKGYNGSVKVEENQKGDNVFPIFLNMFGKGYINIFIGQCVLTLMLFSGLILYRAYPTTELGKFYSQGLEYMNKDLSKEINVERFSKEHVVATFNEVKSLLNFNEKKEDYISENYICPVPREGGSSYIVRDDKLVITTLNDTNIISSYPGRVKSVKDGVVTINYGEGIEMIYTGLKDVLAVEGMELDSNEVIGKTGVSSEGEVSIEILYMGDRLSPLNCFNLDKSI